MNYTWLYPFPMIYSNVLDSAVQILTIESEKWIMPSLYHFTAGCLTLLYKSLCTQHAKHTSILPFPMQNSSENSDFDETWSGQKMGLNWASGLLKMLGPTSEAPSTSWTGKELSCEIVCVKAMALNAALTCRFCRYQSSLPVPSSSSSSESESEFPKVIQTKG